MTGKKHTPETKKKMSQSKKNHPMYTNEWKEKMKQTTYYEDYKEVKGLKFPYKTTLNVGMEIEFITSEVKINEGVTDADFN